MRLLDTIDAWGRDAGEQDRADHRALRAAGPGPAVRPDQHDRLGDGIRPDLSWLDVPVLDRKGRVVHDGGVTARAGFLRGCVGDLGRQQPGGLRNRVPQALAKAVRAAKIWHSPHAAAAGLRRVWYVTAIVCPAESGAFVVQAGPRRYTAARFRGPIGVGRTGDGG